MKKINSNNINYKFSKDIEPVLRIKSGEIVKIETLDCYNELLNDGITKRSEINSNKINPITGPIYIDNTVPGDVLKVDILDIETKDIGVMVSKSNMGLLGNEVKHEDTKIIKIKENKLIFSEMIELETTPMMGIIGVVPKNDDIDSSIPGNHGGNLDTKEIRKGGKIYLPIFQKGALLSVGDLHSSMGDGEISGTGVEVSGIVTIRINIIERENLKFKIDNPIVELNNSFYFLYSDKDFIKSCKSNINNLYNTFKEIYPDLSFNDIYKLISISCDLRISQMVNKLVTSKIRVPKKLIGTIK